MGARMGGRPSLGWPAALVLPVEGNHLRIRHAHILQPPYLNLTPDKQCIHLKVYSACLWHGEEEGL